MYQRPAAGHLKKRAHSYRNATSVSLHPCQCCASSSPFPLTPLLKVKHKHKHGFNSTCTLTGSDTSFWKRSWCCPPRSWFGTSPCIHAHGNAEHSKKNNQLTGHTEIDRRKATATGGATSTLSSSIVSKKSLNTYPWQCRETRRQLQTLIKGTQLTFWILVASLS